MKESMKAALAFKEHNTILSNFAYDEFSKYLLKEGYKLTDGIWFNGYEVIDENTLKVKYQYGGGDKEFDASFKVKI